MTTRQVLVDKSTNIVQGYSDPEHAIPNVPDTWLAVQIDTSVDIIPMKQKWDGINIVAIPDSDFLPGIKAAKVAELSAACQAAIYAGFDSDALGTTHHYPANDNDQRNLNASITASLLPGLPSTWTTPFWCSDSSGTWAMRDHTAAQIQKAGVDGMTAILANMAKNDSLAQQVNAATDANAVAAINW